MNARLKTAVKSVALLLLCCVTIGSVGDLSAEAKKKKKDAGENTAVQADAELQKSLEPINGKLTKLMIRLESRALLSPNEAGQLVDIKYKLLDVMYQHPQNALVAKPIFQAGMLFSQREEYHDAYELFNYLAMGFPTNPYGAKAKAQLQQLEKRFGPDYFPAVMAVTPAAPEPAAGETGEKKPKKP